MAAPFALDWRRWRMLATRFRRITAAKTDAGDAIDRDFADSGVVCIEHAAALQPTDVVVRTRLR